MLNAAKKDVLPAKQRSMVINEYVCHSDSRYVGRTTQRLQERINPICTGGGGGKFVPPLCYFNIAPKRKQSFALMHPDFESN